MSGGENAQQRVVDGRFALEARLGGGGMGTVWRARDLVLDRAVALKEVRPPDPLLAEEDPEGARTLRERVLREARALARVEHPNVVTIHHVVESGDSGYPWLVMELVTGGSLQDRLARGPLAPVEAARLGREVLAALRAAHAAGIQHRDVKPANVLLRPDGRPVLTDFGIAAIRESTALTTTGSLIGTPDYMAPERITGDDGGPGADLWSLAMMLYVAVEGHHPLRRATTMATLAAVLSEDLPAPANAGPLTGLLAALLVRDPAARPGAEAVDGMLAAVLRGEESTPPPRAPEATSYRLTPPPVRPPVSPAPPAYEPFTGPDPYPPYDAVPQDASRHLGPRAGAADPRTAHPQPQQQQSGGRRRAGATVAASVLGTVLVGVLVWSLLPEDGANQAAEKPSASASTPAPGSGSTRPERKTTPPAAPAADAPQTANTGDTADSGSGGTETGAPPQTLLSPAGIRLAIREVTAKAGTDLVADFSVYPEYANVQTIVKGSTNRYDSYTYRIGQGVSENEMMSGTMMSMHKAVRLSEYDWDALPGLMRRAEKELKVENPTSRYLSVDNPNTLLGSGPGLSLYLSDKYGSGYLKADPQGKVTDIYPAG
ncbi:serine/threonine-protein kinase [Streptomyces yaizuensis]|uniref:non-specific serine/threonine protein kinase n=1 Tax=Streptomyces yaizuensis TaxID=2989713 RepID=A0ABQ5P608_9ACTN|nr:serine/threonine-protein kinase [Streptomyces sp. YSPA8]GLF97925.1 serine/threonine protein kinase [Streptomyces sp. YSPA8]